MPIKYFTQGDSCRHSFVVNPEGHPGQHDHQGGGEIGLQQEEEDVSMQSEVDVQTVVPAWGTHEEASEVPSGVKKDSFLEPSSLNFGPGHTGRRIAHEDYSHHQQKVKMCDQSTYYNTLLF